MKMKKLCGLIVFMVAAGTPVVLASKGDRSPFHQQCLSNCVSTNCSDVGKFNDNQPFPERLLAWDCEDECRYQCMWKTVDAFTQAGQKVPQFHGKWPFQRILGVQEPAAAFFSICNLVPHLIMQTKFQRVSDSSTPMHYVWSLYGVVSVNTWFWSTVFHSRDFEFTERMDYFCAFSVVSYSLAAFLLRLLGSDWNWASVSSAAAVAAVFARHVHHMAFVRFDYGYNMAVNVGVGAANSLCWLAWCAYYGKARPHARKAAAAVLMLNLSVLLELLDFAPILWTLDSHALWHATTAPVHFLWYGFLIDDAVFLKEQQKLKDKAREKVA